VNDHRERRVTRATPEDLANALAFSLSFDGRKQKHYTGAFMACVVAERLVKHPEQGGFVVMKKPPNGGATALARAFPRRQASEARLGRRALQKQ